MTRAATKTRPIIVTRNRPDRATTPVKTDGARSDDVPLDIRHLRRLGWHRSTYLRHWRRSLWRRDVGPVAFPYFLRRSRRACLPSLFDRSPDRASLGAVKPDQDGRVAAEVLDVQEAVRRI